MAITQTIATLPAVLNDSATFYEDIAERNNSLVTTVLPSINAWALQANTTQSEINAKAAQVAAQAVDGGYSQNYINSNFVSVNNAQNITAIKTFTVSPIIPNATTSTQAMAYGQGVNLTTSQTIAGVKTFSSTISGSINGNAGTVTDGVYTTGNQTIAGVKTFSSSPIVPTPTTTGNVITMDNIIQKTPVGIGYGAGSGGTVTQLTNKNFNVSLNKPTGTIITSDSALVPGQGVWFTFLNSLLSINDNLKLTPKGVINYDIDVIDIYGGAAAIRIINKDSISHSDAISINFSIEKGANS